MKVFRKSCLKELGTRLKYLRVKKGLSLNMFAYENDMNSSTVSRIENGQVDLKYSTLMMYAIALEMPVLDVIAGIEYTEDIDV